MDAGTNEILAGAAFFIGTVIATIVAYVTKKPPPSTHDAVIAGVGLEFGSRQMHGETNEHLKSIADSLRILADRKQAGIEAKLDRLIEDLDEREERAEREDRHRR